MALAKVLLSQANFLLLDEPTNHLDMQSVNILIQALEQYEGTYVVVSHDRYFVSQIANKIWYIEDEQIKEYPGTYDEYEWWQEERKAQGITSSKQPVDNSKLQPVTSPAPVSSGQIANGKSTNGRVSEDERKEWHKTLKVPDPPGRRSRNED